MAKSIKRLWLMVGMTAMMAGCSDRGAPPKDLLSKPAMVRTMTELYLTEQRINSMGLKRDSLKQIFEVVKPKALSRAGTNDSTFKLSLDYYQQSPEDMEDIFGALIDTLNLHEQRLISNEVKK